MLVSASVMLHNIVNSSTGGTPVEQRGRIPTPVLGDNFVRTVCLCTAPYTIEFSKVRDQIRLRCGTYIVELMFRVWAQQFMLRAVRRWVGNQPLEKYAVYGAMHTRLGPNLGNSR